MKKGVLCIAIAFSIIGALALPTTAFAGSSVVIEAEDIAVSLSGAGWSYDPVFKALTLKSGYSFTITGGAFQQRVINYGIIEDCRLEGMVINRGSGEIRGGRFSGTVYNIGGVADGLPAKSIISGGVFTGVVNNCSIITGGTFSGTVSHTAKGSVEGGDFALAKVSFANSGSALPDVSSNAPAQSTQQTGSGAAAQSPGPGPAPANGSAGNVAISPGELTAEDSNPAPQSTSTGQGQQAAPGQAASGQPEVPGIVAVPNTGAPFALWGGALLVLAFSIPIALAFKRKNKTRP